VTPHLSLQQLGELARDAPAGGPCARCATLRCPGWESLPAGFDDAGLRLLGTRREPQAYPDHLLDPTWAEHRPQGARIDSPAAPIAPAFHPYNRRDLHACAGCGQLMVMLSSRD
jgi:hypothetical protein